MSGKKQRGGPKGRSKSSPTLTVTVVPTDGASTDHKVVIPKEGLTAKQVCDKLKIPSDKKNLVLNGALVSADTLITPSQVLKIMNKPAVEQFRVEERSQGS